MPNRFGNNTWLDCALIGYLSDQSLEGTDEINARNRRNRTSAGLRAASALGVVSSLTLGTAVSAMASPAEIRATQPVSTSIILAVAAGEDEYRQARDAIQRALQQQASETAVVQQAGSSLGSRFGLEVFRVIADTGASWALDEILRELGYGDDIAGDLASIYASIGALSEQVEKIHEKIEELLDESDRSE